MPKKRPPKVKELPVVAEVASGPEAPVTEAPPHEKVPDGEVPHHYEVSPNPFHRTRLKIIGAPTPLGPVKKPTGRPKGTRSRMLDLTHRLLNSKGEKVVKKIIDIALDDKNPNQMQALKLCIERIAPTSFFEDVANKGSNHIEIKVTVTDPRLAALAEPIPLACGTTIDSETGEVTRG